MREEVLLFLTEHLENEALRLLYKGEEAKYLPLAHNAIQSAFKELDRQFGEKKVDSINPR